MNVGQQRLLSHRLTADLHRAQGAHQPLHGNLIHGNYAIKGDLPRRAVELQALCNRRREIRVPIAITEDQ
ncbi:MAG: hypothetical protein BWY63_03216 [Chloroflexi bacterium ADurb.Bin360]|nr:MAG: hypothetical protein BWY63_03216 [Chloroflexi bacterium ADurb.Bin360]